MTVPRILLVDDDPGAVALMSRVLSGLGELRFATSGSDALRIALAARPDLILLDAQMPDMSGFEVCRALKADPALADAAVIFVTSHHEPEFEVRALEIGAVDFIAKPINPPLLVARARTQLRIKRMADDAQRLSLTDSLTGVANRRCFDEVLERECGRARRSTGALSLCLIDVDHFKRFNDRYGHPAGDACLRSVARALASCAQRPADVLARYGGEEFALLLPETPEAGAGHVARRLLDAVAALAIAHDDSPVSPLVTVSVGLAVYAHSRLQDSENSRPPLTQLLGGAATNLLDAADRALYSAKRDGRARVCGPEAVSLMPRDPSASLALGSLATS